MFWEKQDDPLEEELTRNIRTMKNHEPDSEEYNRLFDRVAKLHEVLTERKVKTTVSKDTLYTVGANLIGIVLIITHEYTSPLTSKALSLILRPRV